MWKGLRDIPNGVILGDCLKVMPRLPTGSVDLIVTDPPYLVDYKARDGRAFPNDRDEAWLAPAYREMHRLLKRDAYLVSFYGWFKVHRFMEAWLAAGFRPVGHIVWTKHYRSNSGYLHYRHEHAYLLTKGAPRPRVDGRRLLATLLDRWLGLDADAVLVHVFAHARRQERNGRQRLRRVPFCEVAERSHVSAV